MLALSPKTPVGFIKSKNQQYTSLLLFSIQLHYNTIEMPASAIARPERSKAGYDKAIMDLKNLQKVKVSLLPATTFKAFIECTL